ncbi:MAG TPA: HAMP domain-containing sensor histidine kinase [Tepidisphaeraceae bacterium]|jgi:signal transduction histidine kinase|nr:HAMP domain-containing sensor histidine kinase [Tepidisphaeraceae bacterium]
MTLKGKFLVRNGVLVVMLLLLGAASIWGLWGLRQQVNLALYEYENLRIIESAESATAKAQTFLNSEPSQIPETIAQLQSAREQAKSFGVGDSDSAPIYNREKRLSDFSAARADDAIAKLQDDPQNPQTRKQVNGNIDAMLGDMHQIASNCHEFIQSSQAAATQRLQTTIWVMGGLSLAAIVGALLVTVSQYRLVIWPLKKLRLGVKNVTAKQFAARVEVRGDAEFSELAGEFNTMASQLEDLYRTLEAKVAEKSKELVRSERLASVGFLAAGVAHEINNPLSIISGYAELSLKCLLDSPDNDPQSIADAAQALRIIRDESFRCKEITEKLLSLTKSGTRNKEPFSLAQLAEEVTGMIRGLQTYRDRRVLLGMEQGEPLTVYGNANEIKQVLLNLTINALEATPPRDGEVRVAAKRVNEWVELEVVDNGRGMAAEVVDHVFEPFFTAKRGVSEPGTGLGLSISHAIIESHGGQVRASSAGVGQGSRFVIRLPAAGAGV